MKKLLIAALFASAVIVSGCSACKGPKCSNTEDANDPACDRCVTEYCELIGTRVTDPALRGDNKMKKYPDGTVIRSYPKSKITKW